MTQSFEGVAGRILLRSQFQNTQFLSSSSSGSVQCAHVLRPANCHVSSCPCVRVRGEIVLFVDDCP
jgi:hypothetical protein